MTTSQVHFDFHPYKLSGTVYGTLLNHREALEALGNGVELAPYKGPPKAPVLYMKPRNTLSTHGHNINLPAGALAFQIGASLGLVIGRTACHVPLQTAIDYVAGYVVVADLSVPHENFYRPSLRFKAIDGSCVIGSGVVSTATVKNPDALAVRVFVDGEHVHSTATSGMVRTALQLVTDVTEFMTLAAGDVLLLGVAQNAPLVRVGQRIAVEIENVGRLEAQVGEEQS